MAAEDAKLIAAAIEKAGQTIAQALFDAIIQANRERVDVFAPKGRVSTNAGYGQNSVTMPFPLVLDEEGKVFFGVREDGSVDYSAQIEAGLLALDQLNEAVSQVPVVHPPTQADLNRQEFEEMQGDAPGQGGEPPAPSSGLPHTQGGPTAQQVNQGGGVTLDPQKRLTQAPKAGDRVPGTWWTVICTTYQYTPGPERSSLEFWNEGRKYAEAYTSSDNPHGAWPTAWLDKLQAGGPWPFGKPVEVTCWVSSNKSESNGNYYVDVVKLATVTG